MLQRIRENEVIMELALFVLMLVGFGHASIGRRGKAVEALSQVHRTSRSKRMRRLVESYVVANLDGIRSQPGPLEQDVRRLLGNRLLVLKAPAPGGEKGVLFVMFTEVIRLLLYRMNLPKLMEDYTLVFEPSWSGYCYPEFLQFTRYAENIFVLAAEEDDYAFLKRLGSNLIPVGLGPCDWVDPRVAETYLSNAKDFDIVMNSNWAAWKRHYVLFRMLAKAKQRYTVALIGVRWAGATIADIERLAKFYGVRRQITIHERLPYEKVMDVTCRSRVSILLSLKEGSNRAMAESMFCNVPVIVLSNHIGGIRKNVVPETGLLSDEDRVEDAVNRMLSGRLSPRDWALEHISCFKSSERLNAVLREHALSQGRPWTQDIAGRSSSPESKYIRDTDAERLAPWNEGLTQYLSQNCEQRKNVA